MTETVMISEKYITFKYALEYFVTHLEYVQNNKKNIPGYEKYLKHFVDSNNFRKQGAGYSKKRHYKIQEQIDEYSEYEYGKLCITVTPSKWDGSYTDKGSYLHWLSTAINIVAVWEEDNKRFHIKGLQLLVAKWNKYKFIRPNIIAEKSLVDLDLFSTNIPNKTLIDFYDNFESLLFEDEEKESKIENQFGIKSHKAPKERIFRSSKCERKINIKHTVIQDLIIRELKKKYGNEAVFQEVGIQDTRLDVLVKIRENNKILYDIYEVKPYGSFYSCVREAIGQLMEYKFKAQEKGLHIRNLIIVGAAKVDAYYLKYIQEKYSSDFDYMYIENINL